MKIKHLKEFVREAQEEWAKKYPFPVEGKDILMCPHYHYSSYDSSPCIECLTDKLVKREFDIIDSIHSAVEYETDD